VKRNDDGRLPVDTDRYCFIITDMIACIGSITCSTCTNESVCKVFHGTDYGKGIAAMETHEWLYHRPWRGLADCTYCGADSDAWCKPSCVALDPKDYR
jgi:hypothetical protein